MGNHRGSKGSGAKFDILDIMSEPYKNHPTVPDNLLHWQRLHEARYLDPIILDKVTRNLDIVQEPEPVPREQLEQIALRKILSRAQLQKVDIWTLDDLCIYFQRERHWIQKNVIPKLEYHVVLGKTSYYHKEDILSAAKRTPTDRRKMQDASAKKEKKKKKNR